MVYPARRASDHHRRVATRVAMRQSPEALRAWCWMACGLLAVIAALGLYMVDPLDCIMTWQMTLMPGTLAYSFWGRELELISVRVFLFNVTNPEAFLSGVEDLHVEEVGPFRYRELATFTNLSLENDKATYRIHRRLEFVREESVGDPTEMRLTVPNIVLLGAASLLGNRALVTNLALRSLAGFLGSKTLISLTAEELLWGYDDPLVHMAHTVLPFFVDFRRLGLLDRMYTPAVDDVVLRAGMNNGSDPTSKVATGAYSMYTFNHASGFPDWGHGLLPRSDPHSGVALPAELPCDTLRGNFEGMFFPRHIIPGQKIYIYRKQFCRPAPLIYTGPGVSEEGYRYLSYRLYTPSFLDTEDPENLCYCSHSAGIEGACFPSGFSSIAPCYYRLPLALSQPHFLNINHSVISRVVGMKPILEEHDSILHLQQDLGVPLMGVSRIQMNLLMGHTRLPATQRFNNIALPLMWVELKIIFPEEVKPVVWLALKVAPVLQALMLAALAVGGVAMAARGVQLWRRLPAIRRGSTGSHLPTIHRGSTGSHLLTIRRDSTGRHLPAFRRGSTGSHLPSHLVPLK